MSEPSLMLVTALYALGWLRAWRRPRWWWGAALGGGLVVGMLHHETLLVLLPPTLALATRTSYPVTVVAFGRNLDPETFDAVDRRVPLDVVALPEWGSPPRPPLLEAHLLERDYRPLGHESGFWIYASPRLFRKSGRAAVPGGDAESARRTPAAGL